jgi:hypothetical protein
VTRRAALVNVAKLFSTPDCEDFLGFGWILSSTVRMGQELPVVGEAYAPDVDRPGAGIWGFGADPIVFGWETAACRVASAAHSGQRSMPSKYGGSFLSVLVNRPPHDQPQDHYMKNVYTACSHARTPWRAHQWARHVCLNQHVPGGG